MWKIGRILRWETWLGWIVLLVCVLPAHAGERVRIEVHSSWTGLGSPSQSTLLITGRGNRYSANGHGVPTKNVDLLLEAVHEPPIDSPSLGNCGIDAAWLGAHADRARRVRIQRKLTARQIAFFKSRFTDLRTVQKAFSEEFSGWHTDDYPKMSVSISVDGKNTFLSSSSQYPLMLPWRIQANGSSITYNCHISLALTKLLPRRFTNRDRLALNDHFLWELSDWVMNGIQHDWNMLDTEEKLGSELDKFRTRFKILESQIGNLNSVDVDGKKAWNAQLHGDKLPVNVNIGLSLRYTKGHLVGAGEFLGQIKNYEALVLSVPWLRDYLSKHLDTTLELRYVDDQSLSHLALGDLVQDMRSHDKGPIADRLEREASVCAFLQIDEGSGKPWSRWVVFPNKQMLLWHFSGDSVLKWKATQFATWDFAGLQSTGAVVDPDGALSH